MPLLAAAATARERPGGAQRRRDRPGARAALHLLWAASVESKSERVACLASAVEGDTVRITAHPAAGRPGADSLAVSAEASLETCGPPDWQGTVHTHIALLRRPRPYSQHFPVPIGA